MYLPYFKINAVSSFPIVEYRIEKPNGEPFPGTDWQASPEFINVIPIPTGTNYIVLKVKDEQDCIASYEFYTGAFQLRVVGGRTAGSGIMTSWHTDQLAESRIKWAITGGFAPPLEEEYQYTEWNNNFTQFHEIPFPEAQMGAYHWFYAFSRTKYGRTAQSGRRGIYIVPDEIYLDPGAFYPELHIENVSYSSVFGKSTNIDLRILTGYPNLENSFTAFYHAEQIPPATGTIEHKTINLYTNIVIE